MKFINKNKLTLIGVVLGGIAGYAYYHYVGCASGTCAITSKPLNSSLYGAMMGGLILNIFKKEKQNKLKMNIAKIINEEQPTIVDVRTRSEYMGGHVAGSINIPLQELGTKTAEVKLLKQPLVLCCASGGRSGQAVQILSQQGVTCYNGGSWLDVNYYQTQKA